MESYQQDLKALAENIIEESKKTLSETLITQLQKIRFESVSDFIPDQYYNYEYPDLFDIDELYTKCKLVGVHYRFILPKIFNNFSLTEKYINITAKHSSNYNEKNEIENSKYLKFILTKPKHIKILCIILGEQQQGPNTNYYNPCFVINNLIKIYCNNYTFKCDCTHTPKCKYNPEHIDNIPNLSSLIFQETNILKDFNLEKYKTPLENLNWECINKQIKDSQPIPKFLIDNFTKYPVITLDFKDNNELKPDPLQFNTSVLYSNFNHYNSIIQLLPSYYKYHPHLNDLYLSERLKEKYNFELQELSQLREEYQKKFNDFEKLQTSFYEFKASTENDIEIQKASLNNKLLLIKEKSKQFEKYNELKDIEYIYSKLRDLCNDLDPECTDKYKRNILTTIEKLLFNSSTVAIAQPI